MFSNPPNSFQAKKNKPAARTANPIKRGRVWVLNREGKPAPVDVFIGITDSSFTEIVRGSLEPGQEVITGYLDTADHRKNSGRRFGF